MAWTWTSAVYGAHVPTSSHFIFSSWRALCARASGLTAIVLLCEVLQEERDLGCAVKEQGETSVLHDSIIQERGGAACFPRLDGAHPRLAQPTFPLGLLRMSLSSAVLVSSEADGIVLCFFPT